MNKILVTGGNGFIGKHVISELEKYEFEIHTISRKIGIQNAKNIYYHTANLFDFKTIEHIIKSIRPSHMIHLAWYTEHGKYWNDSINYKWIDVSQNLIKCFCNCGGQRVISAGTCAEYTWGTPDVLNEYKSLRKPSSIYGQCKLNLQEFAVNYCKDKNVSCVWTPIFFPYGPGENNKRLFSSIIIALLKGENPQCSHGKQKRDFIYAKDIANAIIAILKSDITGIINIGTGVATTIAEVSNSIKSKINGENEIQFGVISTPKDDPQSIVADVTRLRNEINWIPKYSLEAGITETINWWKSRLDSSAY